VFQPGFNPGVLTTPQRRALQGRQIESTNNVEIEIQWVRLWPSQLSISFCATMDVKFSWHLSPFQGEPLFWGFPGLKPWAESYSPFGASLLDRRMTSS
jgi:hypothetical protein